MITIIHEYCVYESFDKMGWLFTNSMPQKPRIKFNYRMFKRHLMDKIASTFNDNNKMLFRNLLAIIDYTGSGFQPRNFSMGHIDSNIYGNRWLIRCMEFLVRKSFFQRLIGILIRT